MTADRKKIEKINNKKADLPSHIKDILDNPDKYADGCSAKEVPRFTADFLYTFALNKLVPDYCSTEMRWEYGPGGFRVYWGDDAPYGDNDNISLRVFLEHAGVRCNVDFDIKNKELPTTKIGNTFLSPAFNLVPNLDYVTEVFVGKGQLTTYENLVTGDNGVKDILKTGERHDNQLGKNLDILCRVIKDEGLFSKKDKIRIFNIYGNFEIYLEDPSLTRVGNAADALREFTDFYQANEDNISELVQRLACPKCKDDAETLLRDMKSEIPREIAKYI